MGCTNSSEPPESPKSSTYSSVARVTTNFVTHDQTSHPAKYLHCGQCGRISTYASAENRSHICRRCNKGMSQIVWTVNLQK